MYEASVVTVGDDGEPIYPYFDKTYVQNYVSNFLETDVAKYSNEYTINVSFYLLDGVTLCTEDDLARNVKIELDAKINDLFKYKNNRSFSILERDLL